MSWGIGKTLQHGRYTIHRILGEGGFGTTYLAWDDQTQKDVVVKTLNESLRLELNFEKFQQDFMNEALRLARCDHPHIVRVQEVILEEGLWAIVMDYIEGETVYQRLYYNGFFPESEALQLTRQIGDALKILHQQNILHRDVKPANLILRRGKLEVVLIDFGLARDFYQGGTQVRTCSGTDGFAPLEQYDPNSSRGPYTDIYALAATLYTMLTGQVPMRAPIRAAGRKLMPPKQINPALSEEVNQAILKGLGLRAEDRPQSVSEWLALLPTPSSPVYPVADPIPSDPVPAAVLPSKAWIRKFIGNQDRYQIEEHLGSGGMGKVFRAFDRHINRQVAIKILMIQADTKTSHLIQRFEQEVLICGRLNSPCIVQVSDVGVTNEGYPFYVMEYLQGKTLGQFIQEKKVLSLGQTLPIVLYICEGLRVAHQAGIVHRDLKPDNIFLLPGPLGHLVKILDFGISKIIDTKPGSITMGGAFVGTYQYAAPEQCESTAVDQRTDIYSLGMVIYQALSGTNPFGLANTEPSTYHWMDAHIRITPHALRQQPKCHHLPEQIESIVMRCLKKDPGERFRNIEELEMALQSFVKDTPDRGNLTTPLTPVEIHPPQPPFSPQKLPYPSGLIPIDSPAYISFPVEQQIYQEIQKLGSLIRIKAPKEMGKTSLLIRVLDYAEKQGFRTVSLNLEQVDHTILSDLNRLLRWMCADTTRQLDLDFTLNDYWDEDVGSKISCTLYFRSYILKKVRSPLLIVFDEVNQVFEYPIVAKDFFPLLRIWYEEAKRQPAWKELRLIVGHSTEIYVPLQLKQSPFNVGIPIQLDGFSLDQVKELANRYGVSWQQDQDPQKLMNWVGGHPSLVHLAIYHLSQGETLDILLEAAATPVGIYAQHLQRHQVILEDNPELMESLQMVMSASEPVRVSSVLAHKLNSLGLVKWAGDKLVPGCYLYQRFFSENLRKKDPI